MRKPAGSNAFRSSSISFRRKDKRDVRIKKKALDRAIAGGLRRGGFDRFNTADHDDMVADVQLELVASLRSGRTLRGKVGSLAYGIARWHAIDRYRRPGRDAMARRSEGEASYLDARSEAGDDDPFIRLAEAAETEWQRRRVLEAAAELSDSDRQVLIGMLRRTEPLPRRTPAEIRAANATAQREKRVRDRLRAIIFRDGDPIER
ncbi:hypothetical protein NHN26_15910 [Rhodovulum tesquicola]|uniref:RNA polymerase sigma factor n=1 Tax=Rhodovulum tesquicola TaxID=540254 RepID=UPI002097205F|nr:hypothetical protein [Rhodovulum tesquicola]MCO8146698.1 hypothetical protein [Rhodovulum tesquicola]